MAESEMRVAASDLHLAFGPTRALAGADVTVRAGEAVALMGPSGSGKSTLLHCLSGVLVPDSGQIELVGRPLAEMSEAERSDFRLRHVGMVFQFGGLVPELTLAENVMLPLQLVDTKTRLARARADELLDALGIGELGGHVAGTVSGGQAQRAAVARALAHRPAVLLADEPTGALDTVTAEVVLDQLLALAGEMDTAVVIVTHDNRVAAHCDRIVTITDGRILTPETVG
jgi:putative ABC transport system ATP-binding protein